MVGGKRKTDASPRYIGSEVSDRAAMTWKANEPRQGYWMVKVVRGGPYVAARIWLCSHEPGEPDNLMDRPYWQGQIGLDLTPPLQIWGMVEFVESSPEQQNLLVNPPLSDRAPQNGRAAAFKTAPLARWRQTQAYRITPAQYAAEIDWQNWAKNNAPHHPEFTYRRPINRQAAPIPRFT